MDRSSRSALRKPFQGNRASRPKTVCGNEACGSHLGLDATAAHSREAGYIYAAWQPAAAWRRSPPTCSVLSAVTVLLLMSKNIPQDGPVQRGWINLPYQTSPSFINRTQPLLIPLFLLNSKKVARSCAANALRAASTSFSVGSAGCRYRLVTTL
jgi:hypothetical protein